MLPEPMDGNTDAILIINTDGHMQERQGEEGLGLKNIPYNFYTNNT